MELLRLKRRNNHFRSLVREIVNQQLSGRAAATILSRFIRLFPGNSFPTPKQVLAQPVRKLRSAGLSGQKALYIRELARAVESGQLNFRKIVRLPDEDVIVLLTRQKGIGRWTAEMFLMFSLGRPDIFSFGDLGLRKALTRLYGKRGRLTLASMQKIAARWSPYRTYAAQLLWASNDVSLDELG